MSLGRSLNTWSLKSVNQTYLVWFLRTELSHLGLAVS